jgi:hypothetical protein
LLAQTDESSRRKNMSAGVTSARCTPDRNQKLQYTNLRARPKIGSGQRQTARARVRILIVRPRRINNEDRAKIRAGGPTKISRKTKGHEREKPILLARYKNRGFDPAQEPRTSGQVK